VATPPRVSPALTRATGLCANARRVALPRRVDFFSSLLFSLHLREITLSRRGKAGNVIASAAKQSRVHAVGGSTAHAVGATLAMTRRTQRKQEKILPFREFSLE
jgi:hypothetical protein